MKYLLAALVLTACSSASPAAPDDAGTATCSSATTFSSAPIATLTGDKGKVTVAVHSAPHDALVPGLQCVEVVVADASSGAVLDGLTVTLTPWMPAMDHGASVTPTVTPLGEGRYVFTNVALFMPGEWELRMQFSGEVSDSVAPTFSVE